MGTLRLKRGTKTALQTNPGFTPAEGELVYTTDSKEVFVGDGVTQGGVPVSVSTQNLEDLGNVQALAAQKDQILVYNGSNWAASANPALDLRGNIYADDSTLLVDAVNGKIVGPVETSSVTATNIVGNLAGDTTGSHTGSVVGNVVGNTTGSHTGPVTGDVKGSVFGDDSTAIVDAVDNSVIARVMKTDTMSSNITQAIDVDNSDLNVSKNGDVPRFVLRRDETASLAQDQSCGRIIWQKDISGSLTAIATMSVAEQQWNFIPSPAGTPDYSKTLRFHRNGKLGINGTLTAEPDANLHVTGNVKISGGELLLGNMTTTERDALTAANGMIIYNTTLNKFQGYENGSWANLI